ncbi:MAG: DUF4365 domain-containing protein [Pseudonocardiaceae bacterium]
MAQALTSVTGDAGVWGVGHLVATQLGWYFRPQPVADVGIDAQVEPVLGGQASGRFLALQIKAGASWFKEPMPVGDGWVFRESNQVHRDYWLNCTIPVLLMLYDVDKGVAYWQHITPDTAIVTGNGFKVEVPSSQRLDATARDILARLAREVPPDGLSEILDQLPTPCANLLRLWDETDPTRARCLAADLVAGRDHPAQVIQEVTAEWDHYQSWLAWLAVGEYANEYGLSEVAAEHLLAADRSGGRTAPPGRLRAFAGLLLTSSDPDRARGLLAECTSVPQSHLLAAVGLATLNHGAKTGAIPIPPEIMADPEGAAGEPTAQRFLAEQRMRVGDWDGAIEHHRQALAHAPDSTEQRLALAYALLKRAGTGSISGAADYREAAALAEAARAEYRRWRGDSVPAAHLLMQARILVADDASAFRVAQAQPDGEATAEEARSPRLAFEAARIAYGRGDLARGDEFGTVIEASEDPIWLSHLTAIQADATGADITERERAWRAVLAVDDEASRRLVVCAHLAEMGCWPVLELDEMDATTLLTPGMYDVLHARALVAVHEETQALILLRGLCKQSLAAAEAYAQLLASLGRVEDCVRACEQASTRFGDARLDLFALDVLTRAGQADQVIVRATELLGRTDLTYRLRHHIRVKLIDEHARRQAWDVCERLAQRGWQEIIQHQADLRTGRHDALTVPASAAADLADLRRQYAWSVIINQFNQGHADRAFATLGELEPDVRTQSETTTWFDLHQIHGWTSGTAEFALRLAERPDQPPDLIGKILFTLAQSVPVTDDPTRIDFHERLGCAWRTYVQEHQPPGVQVVTPQQMLDQIRADLEADATRFAPISKAIWSGTLPVGAASTASSRPYLLGLAQRAAGLLPAVPLNEQIHRLEVQSALNALDRPVAVETSALYVAAALLTRWPSIGPEFSELLLAEPTERDILLSQTMARSLTNISGAIGLAPDNGALGFSELTDDARAAIVSQCGAVHEAAQTGRVVPIDNLDALGSGGPPISYVGAWMAPLAVAVEHQVSLYSDDMALRAMARGKGVEAFGTLALLDALLAAGRGQLVAPDTVLSVLFDHHVVDLPQAARLVLAAGNPDRSLTPPILLNLARPALWQRHSEDALGMVIELASRLPPDDARSVASLVSACAAGWAAAFTPAEAVIAQVATLVLAYHTGVTIDAARIVIPVIRAVAAQYDADPVPYLRKHLIGVLTDPSDRFQMTLDSATETVDDALREFP